MVKQLWPPDGFRRTELSQRKGACFLLNKKEALSELIQVNEDEERNSGQQGESMVVSFRYLGVSNPGLVSNSCGVSYQ